jgi:selenocysteine-specific elongation factor
VSFHTGAAEAMARLRLLEGDTLAPGESGWAQIVLEEPVAVVKGDRYIIRSTMETLGGGQVIDTHARRLRRNRPEIISNLEARESGNPEDLILALLETHQPVERSVLITQANLPAGMVAETVDALVTDGRIVNIGEAGAGLLFTAPGWKKLENKAVEALGDYHKKYPLRPGMPKIELASRLKLGTRAAAVVNELVQRGTVIEDGNLLKLPEHAVNINPAQQAIMDAFLEKLARNPYSPPAEGLPEPDLLALLIARGQVVKVADSMVFLKKTYDAMVEAVKESIRVKGSVNLATVRDMFGTSRKYAQAFLEYLDAQKITRRVGDERVLY